MLKGTYRYRIDTKGRLPVPPPFRRSLAQGSEPGSLTLTVMDQCLAAYPPQEWSRLESQLQALPSFHKSVKALTRLLTSQAVDCDLDVQGRILIPAPLRAQAGLKAEVVVVGVLNRFEIWAPERWQEFLVESERLLDSAGNDIPWSMPPSLPELVTPRLPRQNDDPQGKPKE
jgi:MraZ protein